MARFDESILEQRIKSIIRSQGLDGDAPLSDPRSDACRTFVVATSIRAAGSPVLMQTYDNFPLSEALSATIWQAARATSAAPTFFLPVVINGVRYGDGGTGWNNPIELAIDEAHNIWPNRAIGCLVSIGTGLEDAIQLGDITEKGKGLAKDLLSKLSPRTSFKIEVAEWCVELLTGSEKIHRQIVTRLSRLGLDGKYFRLNVPQGMSRIGLEDWEKIDDMIALAEDYMRFGDVQKAKQILSQRLLNPSVAS